jgi:hypothetical protein
MNRWLISPTGSNDFAAFKQQKQQNEQIHIQARWGK